MFFRRTRPKVLTFQDRIDLLRQAGFATDNRPDGRVRIAKHGIAAVIGDESQNAPEIERAGVLVGHQIATLLSGGYQMFLQLPNGERLPATAEQLRNLHQFEEDAKEALGLTSLYNTSLGTTTPDHFYDRVNKRDTGTQPKPWEKKRKRIVPPETKDALGV